MDSLLSRLNGLIVDDNGDIILNNLELPELNEEEAEFLRSNISIPKGARISKSNPRPAIVQVVSSILEMHRQEVKEKKKLAYQKFNEDSEDIEDSEVSDDSDGSEDLNDSELEVYQ